MPHTIGFFPETLPCRFSPTHVSIFFFFFFSVPPPLHPALWRRSWSADDVPTVDSALVQEIAPFSFTRRAEQCPPYYSPPSLLFVRCRRVFCREGFFSSLMPIRWTLPFFEKVASSLGMQETATLLWPPFLLKDPKRTFNGVRSLPFASLWPRQPSDLVEDLGFHSIPRGFRGGPPPLAPSGHLMRASPSDPGKVERSFATSPVRKLQC